MYGLSPCYNIAPLHKGQSQLGVLSCVHSFSVPTETLWSQPLGVFLRHRVKWLFQGQCSQSVSPKPFLFPVCSFSISSLTFSFPSVVTFLPGLATLEARSSSTPSTTDQSPFSTWWVTDQTYLFQIFSSSSSQLLFFVTIRVFFCGLYLFTYLLCVIKLFLPCLSSFCVPEVARKLLPKYLSVTHTSVSSAGWLFSAGGQGVPIGGTPFPTASHSVSITVMLHLCS